MTVQDVPVWIPSQRPLPPSVTSVTRVANDNGDNEMIPETVHRSPGISLTAEENPRKTSADEGAVRPVIASYLQMISVEPHIRNGEGRKDGKDGV